MDLKLLQNQLLNHFLKRSLNKLLNQFLDLKGTPDGGTSSVVHSTQILPQRAIDDSCGGKPSVSAALRRYLTQIERVRTWVCVHPRCGREVTPLDGALMFRPHGPTAFSVTGPPLHSATAVHACTLAVGGQGGGGFRNALIPNYFSSEPSIVSDPQLLHVPPQSSHQRTWGGVQGNRASHTTCPPPHPPTPPSAPLGRSTHWAPAVQDSQCSQTPLPRNIRWGRNSKWGGTPPSESIVRVLSGSFVMPNDSFVGRWWGGGGRF